jgi:hypothetical protein
VKVVALAHILLGFVYRLAALLRLHLQQRGLAGGFAAGCALAQCPQTVRSPNIGHVAAVSHSGPVGILRQGLGQHFVRDTSLPHLEDNAARVAAARSAVNISAKPIASYHRC